MDDDNVAETADHLEPNNVKDTKDRRNEKLKRKQQEKLLKVRKMLKDKLTSKMLFFNSLATNEKTPRRAGKKKPIERVKGNADKIVGKCETLKENDD